MLILGIVGNVALLGYFKYADFFIENYNWVLGADANLLHLALPLAISYFTFQQIAFLVDSYRGETKEYNFLNYSMFITFFPQLLMGPIMHHKEIIPQFQERWKLVIRWENVSLGLFIFAIGLAKKTLLGDPLTDYAQNAFDHAQDLSMIEAWYAAVSYVLSYYFDLSGYADMAIGIGKMFNINIPLNFNSPYKARNFAEYWQRWHMTLSRFLSDYVYKSLGGNKRVAWVMYLNIMITFFVSGFWHGAGWTFVVWGLLNGIFVVMAHMMRKAKFEMNFYIAWGLMFLGVIITRVLFVSDNFSDAWYVTYTMFDISNLRFTHMPYADKWFQTPYIIVGLILALFFKNSIEISKDFKPNSIYLSYTVILLTASLFTFSKAKEFLYFQF
jgi:D-alanyl-lipoteichoic acid acyltransferase DltB (MBOAT superfamily)